MDERDRFGSSIGFAPFRYGPADSRYSPAPEYVPLEEPAETSPGPSSGSQRTGQEIRDSLGVAGGVRGTPLGGGAYQQPDGRIVYLVNRSAAIAASHGATPEEQIATRGQEGDALALIYGYAVHGGTTFFRRVDESGGGYGDLVIGIVWGMGPVERFVSVRNADGTAIDPNIIVENYRGDPADGNYDTVDNKILAVDPTYSDTLVETDEETGLEYSAAYTVFRIPAFLWRSGWPQFQAWIEGHPVYDPRDGSQTFGNFSSYKYSSNAALIQADLYTHPLRGMGRTIDWSTVIGPANGCEGTRKRNIHTRFEVSQPAGNLLDVAGEYASTTIVADQDTANMVELKDETPIATLTVDDTIGGFNVTERPSANTPDIVEVAYSAPDPSETYRRVTRDVRAKRTGLTGNAHPYIRQRIPMPGFIDEDEAYQYAVRRLNGLRNDVEVSWIGRDTGLNYTRADVVRVQDDNGLSNFRVRIVEATLQGRGRFQFKAVMDTAAQYSTDPAPAVPDVPPRYTGLSPLIPVGPPVITLTSFRQADETAFIRFYMRVTIPVSNTWPYTREYKVTLIKDPNGANVPLETVTVLYDSGDAETVIEVQRDTEYRADVIVVGPYNQSASATQSAVVTSDDSLVYAATPSNPKVVQAGLDVIITWENFVFPFLGTTDPNIAGYQIRRGTQSQDGLVDWDQMTLLAELDIVTSFTDQNPGPADHRYAVRSVSKQSATLDLNVQNLDITVDEVSEVNLCPVGDFETWTEGTVFSPGASTEIYVADMFTVIRGGAANWTVERVAGRFGAPSRGAVRMQRNNGDTSDRDMALAFALETQDVIALRGKYISISFWVQTGVHFESGPDAGIIARLRTNDFEGSFYDIRASATNQDLVAANGDMPALPSGPNSWQLMTGAFPNVVDVAAEGLAIAILYQPTGTAQSQDYVEISELAFYPTPYFDKSQDPAYRLPPPFKPLTQAARQAYIRRYLLYSGTNESPAFFEEAMRATPVESGSSPWKYDARL